ncbi:MAG: GGDEF domain-containing protein [Acidimicrobiia bacterium]
MSARWDGRSSPVDYNVVPAWELLIRVMRAPRWLVLPLAGLAGGSLLLVDRLINSDAHVLLGFFVITAAITWTGHTVAAMLTAEVLLAARAILGTSAPAGRLTAQAVVGLISGVVLLTIGIVLTRMFRLLVLQMIEDASRDSLTGLLNTRAFQEVAERERARATRTGEPISIAFLDLDQFKQINDGHGHVVGDAVLTAFGQILAHSVRSVDVVGRVGGDEFTIVLPNTDQFAAHAVLQRIRHRIAMRTDIPMVTATAGYVTFLTPPDSVEEMVHVADDLMYRGKQRTEAGALIGRVVGGSRSTPRGASVATIDITGLRRSAPKPSRARVQS